MNHSERILRTLDFQNMTEDRGTCAETFFPWTLTMERWLKEGLPESCGPEHLYPGPSERAQRYFNDQMTEPVYAYEQLLGLDGVKRMSFRIPFKSFDREIRKDTQDYREQQDEDGWVRRYYKKRDLVQDLSPIVADEDSWARLKEKVERELEQYCTKENLQRIYGRYSEGHKKGDFSIRFRAAGFFWTPRELFGIEEQMYAFYDYPELMHEINEYILDKYLLYFDRIFDIIKPEVILFEEDLSGANGPMISPDMFDEFIGCYYQKLTAFLKKKGVGNVFVDTDGDFRKLIPNFLSAGVDGFLPMDVNAGMDIVRVREEFPRVKFIGAYNKLALPKGRDAIDAEFERLMPVIRQGGYVPGLDHQAAPSTPFENYRYYLKRLFEVMKEAGADQPLRQE